MLKKFHSFQHLAELYHVYHSVHRYMVSVIDAITEFRRFLGFVNERYQLLQVIVGLKEILCRFHRGEIIQICEIK